MRSSFHHHEQHRIFEGSSDLLRSRGFTRRALRQSWLSYLFEYWTLLRSKLTQWFDEFLSLYFETDREIAQEMIQIMKSYNKKKFRTLLCGLDAINVIFAFYKIPGNAIFDNLLVCAKDDDCWLVNKRSACAKDWIGSSLTTFWFDDDGATRFASCASLWVAFSIGLIIQRDIFARESRKFSYDLRV